MAGATQTEPLKTEQVLREEARAIFGDDAKGVENAPDERLYQELNKLDAAALCLSGGGIRSASFALGVIQALAIHPRPNKTEPVATADESLLARFHYLSTVSGGGYIGSWLSAGVARAGFDRMWRTLVHREPKPEDESPQISWLRAYSNYLTPRLGLTSADTWAALALYVRNLMLNWLVFAPVLCGALIVIKLIAVAGFALRPAERVEVAVLLGIALLLQIWALRFALLHRPTRQPKAAVAREAAAPADGKSELRDERKGTTDDGGNQGHFLRRDLLPSLLAACGLTLALLPDIADPVTALDLWILALGGAVAGALLYLVAWLFAWPWPPCDAMRDRVYWLKDLGFWVVAGGAYGALLGLGIYLFQLNLILLIGGIEVTDATKDTLLLLIYGVPWIISAQLTAEMIFVGLTSWQHDSDADREWFGRSTGWFAVSALAWGVIAFLGLIGADLAFELYTQFGNTLGKTTGGVLSVIGGIVTAVLGKSSATSARQNRGDSLWKNVALAVGTVTFLVALVIGASAIIDNLLLDDSLLKSQLVGGTSTTSKSEHLKWLFIGLAIAVVVGWVAAKRVNVNRFSLHALYRNRLIRAFLGATNPDRKPDSFTGFDERDNPRMNTLWKEHAQQKSKQLFHVINIALNVVSPKRLAWQERKAESFTVSPRHCGTASIGPEAAANPAKPPEGAYRRSVEYGAPAGTTPDECGISVGTAMAISGAAASPNMGYHSSPLVTLLLALFNVRLGWWLGNPGGQGKRTYNTEGPIIAFLPLFKEVFGQTTDENPYVYLSDGGHFENLGLYEMVRRRCRFIVVSDAGCDPDFGFEDLGNALRKISIDLGIEIAMWNIEKLKKRGAKFDAGENQLYCAFGEIRYPEKGSKPGFLLYIKPCYHGVEGIGVRAYAVTNPTFPHQTTSDQFFSESQFESYRALGFETADDLLHKAFTGPKRPLKWSSDEIAEALKYRIEEIADKIPPSRVHLARFEAI